ncbi:MAG: hypothetical protein LBC69_01005 [Eubacteriaceae bacterium]|nr:hypothetical protein [Eubacteriaceae bacterium]
MLALAVFLPVGAYARGGFGSAFLNLIDDIVTENPFFPNPGEGSWGNTDPQIPQYPDNRPEEILTDPNFDLDSLNPAVVEQWKAMPVNIPDSRLASQLMQHSASGTGSVTVGDMLALTGDLNLNECGISDLTGLRYAINVSEINIAGNNLTSLSELQNLHKLVSLDYSRNKVTRVPAFLFSMESLESLYGAENGSTAVASYTGTNKIKELYFNNNKFTSFSNIDACPNLETLILSNNTLANAPNALAKLKNIVILDLSNNQLETVPQMSNLAKLSQANFSGNKLADVPLVFSPSAPLAILNLDNNQISVIPEGVAELSSLEFLSLNVNTVKKLPLFLASMPSLKVLQVSLNEIDLDAEADSIKLLQDKLESFAYKLQTPKITLELAKGSSGKPILRWKGLQDMSIGGEGTLRVSSIVIERREETLTEDAVPSEIGDLINKFGIIQELADTSKNEYLDQTAEEGVDYTYRLTAQLEGSFGSSEMDEEPQTASKSASAKINTRDMKGSSFSIGAALLAAGALLCAAAIGFGAYVLIVKKRRSSVPKQKIYRHIEHSSASDASDTTKLELGKGATGPLRRGNAVRSPSSKRRFGERARQDSEEEPAETALDADDADFTKIYR